MDYHIDFGIWGSIFPVPTAVADKHLKLCSESQLKVLLLALRDAPNAVDVQYIGKRLGLTPTQVSDALEYWQQAGVFTQKEGTAPQAAAPKAPSAVIKSLPTEKVEGSDGQQVVTIHSRSKLTPSQINELSRKDPNVPWLLEELQNRLARPLSPAESETVVYLYTYLRLSPDYMLMAVEYCKCIGKTNMRYIEKLITGWVDSGVDTHDKAEKHICELTRRASDEGLVRSMFGMGDRELSGKEKNYINTWFEEYGFSTDLIKLAYEKTVDNTGKVAFPYIHKILSQWHIQGVQTVEQAQREMGSKQQKRGGEEASFDLRDIERVMKQNLNG
ncbi:MAG: DnaD domain protein [Angelakisella sp.]